MIFPHINADLDYHMSQEICKHATHPPPSSPCTQHFLPLSWSSDYIYIYKRGCSVLPDFYSHMRSYYYFRYKNIYIIEEKEEQPEPASSRVSW